MKHLLKMKFFLKFLGLFKIPMLGFTRPQICFLSDDVARIKIRLSRRTKNHLNSMYFGALAVGADLAGGIHAFYFADQLKKNISFSFKGMKADFIKRAETDVIFECKDGLKVKAALEESARTNERVNEVTKVQAFNLQDELVAEFEMQLSVRCK